MNRRTRPTSRTGRALLRVLVAVASLVLSVVVALGAVRAGSSYFYCAAMAEVRVEACCAHAEAHGADESGDAIDELHECCREGRLGLLPSAAPTPRGDGASALDAPSSMALAVTPRGGGIEGAPLARHAYRPGAATGPPRASARSARLMVFLI